MEDKVQEKSVSHIKLVREAANWLRNTARCRLVVSELACANLYEVPDVMGWRASGESMLIECKTSLSDFRCDKGKIHRLGEGLGQERWFYAPKGIIPLSELPENWGLLERRETLTGYFLKNIKEPIQREATPSLMRNERCILVSAAWRACEAASLVKPLMIGGCDG